MRCCVDVVFRVHDDGSPVGKTIRDSSAEVCAVGLFSEISSVAFDSKPHTSFDYLLLGIARLLYCLLGDEILLTMT